MMRRTLMSIGCLAAVIAAWGQSDADNYLPTNPDVVLTETNLPIVFIDTKALDGNTTVIHKDHRVAVRMTIVDNADGRNYADTLAHPQQHREYDGWVGIKYRGVTSFMLAKKKPMGFKTLETSDVDGKKRKVTLLGMPKDNDWVLLAPYHDRSMIRDVLTFELARPYFEYTPRARFCELVMDGIYRGVYIVSERPGKGKHRLNLTEPGDEGEEVTGDYMVEVDSNDDGHCYKSKYKARDEKGRDYAINSYVYFQYKFPEYDDMVPDHTAQLRFIDRRINAMEEALDSRDFRDPTTGYRRYIDVASFVDYMLTQEVTGNPDGYRRSVYMYKRRDEVDPRFKMCLWDFNLAYGASLQELVEANKWHYINKPELLLMRPNKVPFWWARLMEDDDYVTQLKSRWADYRRTSYSEAHITHVIDSLVSLLNVGGACERNYQAWPNWDEEIPMALNNTKSYDEEIDYLRTWLSNRIGWLDRQLGYGDDAAGLTDHGQQSTDQRDKARHDVYDLQGRRLAGSPARKGVYIGSGRKVLIF